MKKLLLLFILLINQVSLSQEIDIKWSEEYDVARRSKALNYLQNDNGYTIIFNNNKENRLFIKQYDQDLNFKLEKDLILDLSKGKYNIKEPLVGDKDIKFFFTEKLKSDDKTVLYASIIDENYNAGPIKIIDEVNTDSPEFFAVNGQSFDKSKIAVAKKIFDKEAKKNNKLHYTFKVFDKNLDVMYYEKDVTVEFDHSAQEVGFEVDNHGNIYFLVRQFIKNKNREKGDSNTFYQLYTIHNQTKEVKVLEYNLQDHYMNSLTLNQVNNEKIVVTGFAQNLRKGNLKNKENVDSFSFLTSVIDPVTLEVTKPLVVDLGSIYPEKIKRVDRIPYIVRDILYREDGSFNIIAEQYFLEVKTVCGQYGCQTYYKYYYNDILSLLFTKDEKLVSITKVPKYQINLDFSSIIGTSIGNNSYIIYEDKAKIANELAYVAHKNSSNPKSRKKNALQMIVIDEQGNASKRKIYDNKEMEKKDLLNVKNAIRLKNGKIIILGNKRIALIEIK